MLSSKPPSLALTSEQFRIISEIAHTEAGLVLVQSKASMIAARLAKRVKTLNLRSLEEYFSLLKSDTLENELPHLLSALTTNVSHFFREEHHFEMLRTTVFPELASRAAKGDRIRIWSAGCSNGQELYSIAMTLAEILPNSANYDVKLLGTDIDPNVIQTAARGDYSESQLKGVPSKMRSTYFANHEAGGGAMILDSLKRNIQFKRLNLIGDWPMKYCFDLIFCRNVVIYFDEKTQERLWIRFEDILKEGAWLFIGHSERIQDLSTLSLRSSGITAYQKLNV